MNKRLRLAALAISLAGLSAPAAWGDWDSKHLKLVRASPSSLRAAVQAAEREFKGKAYYALAIAGDDLVTYTVKVDIGEKAMLAQVDGKTGKITDSSAIPGENVMFLKEFAKQKGSLLMAMKAAEATAKGKSFQAAFKRLGTKDVFEVDIAGRDDVEKDVVIDAASGKIRKVAEKTVDAAGQSGAGNAVPAQ